jgi:DNA replication protein DnaC
MSDFLPLFDNDDPRVHPNRDASKPVLPDRSPQQEEYIKDESIRIRDRYPNHSLPLSIPCCCDGMLWVKPVIDGKTFGVGHPDFAKAVACSCYAAERQGKKRQYLWDICGLSQSENIPTISEYKDDLSPDAKYAKESVVKWMNDEIQPWLILIGPPGLGKTHLARAATANLIGLQKPVMYETVRQLLSKSRDWISSKKSEKWIKYLASLEAIQYLVLDDLGQEYSTDWSKSVLFDIIDTRYESRKPTLITTNISTGDWSNYLGHPSADRLNDFHLSKHIIMTGKSVRQLPNR